MDKVAFTAAFHDRDTLMREWIASVCGAYKNLRDRPDLRLLKYWLSDFRKFLEAGQRQNHPVDGYAPGQGEIIELNAKFLRSGESC